MVKKIRNILIKKRLCWFGHTISINHSKYCTGRLQDSAKDQVGKVWTGEALSRTLGLIQEEAEAAAFNRQQWHRSVAQHVQMNAGWLKVSMKVSMKYWLKEWPTPMNERVSTSAHELPTSVVDGLCAFLCAVCRYTKHFNSDIWVDSVTLGTRCLRLRQLLTTNNLHMQWQWHCVICLLVHKTLSQRQLTAASPPQLYATSMQPPSIHALIFLAASTNDQSTIGTLFHCGAVVHKFTGKSWLVQKNSRTTDSNQLVKILCARSIASCVVNAEVKTCIRLYLPAFVKEIKKSPMEQSNTYFNLKYLRWYAWNNISRASSEVSNFVSHDGWLQDITTATILHESSVTQIHHQTTRLIVQCNCNHMHQLLIR